MCLQQRSFLLEDSVFAQSETHGDLKGCTVSLANKGDRKDVSIFRIPLFLPGRQVTGMAGGGTEELRFMW